MRLVNRKQLAGFVTFLLVVLAAPLSVITAESACAENIRPVLEASPLARSEQADIEANAGAAISAGVSAEDIGIIVSRGIARGMGAKTINRLLAASMSAKKEGLPMRPVLDRIEQGLSKGVPGERIADASERLVEKLAVARPLVQTLIQKGMASAQGRERDEAITTIARAFEKSISAESIKDIGSAVLGRRGTLQIFTRAVDTASYFVSRGVAAQEAVALIRDAVGRGYSGRDMDGMIRRLDSEIRQGIRAEDAAVEMGREGIRREMRIDRGRSTGSGMGGRGR